MKALRIGLLLVIAALLLGVGTSQAAPSAPPEVKIGEIVLEDYEAANDVRRAIRRELWAQDLSATSGSAPYRIDVYQRNAERRRTFNWLILFIPAWPFIGFTASHVDVTVQSSVTTAAGDRVWDGTGWATASTMWFSDFHYPDTDGALARAGVRSIRGVASTLSRISPYSRVDYASNTLKWGLRVGF